MRPATACVRDSRCLYNWCLCFQVERVVQAARRVKPRVACTADSATPAPAESAFQAERSVGGLRATECLCCVVKGGAAHVMIVAPTWRAWGSKADESRCVAPPHTHERASEWPKGHEQRAATAPSASLHATTHGRKVWWRDLLPHVRYG